jgi:hypothetical protein
MAAGFGMAVGLPMVATGLLGVWLAERLEGGLEGGGCGLEAVFW